VHSTECHPKAGIGGETSTNANTKYRGLNYPLHLTRVCSLPCIDARDKNVTK